MPADELSQGLIDAGHDINYTENILENVLNTSQKFPKYFENILQDLKVYQGFDQPAIIKGKIIQSTRTPCKILTQEVDVQTFTTEKEFMTLEEL